MSHRVRIYFNLHKKVFSVQKKTPKGWRVWKHVAEFYLKDAEFKVSQAGRRRVLREKRKNVHAFVEGEWSKGFDQSVVGTTPVTYNPYKSSQFYFKWEHPHQQITMSNWAGGEIRDNQPLLVAG